MCLLDVLALLCCCVLISWPLYTFPLTSVVLSHCNIDRVTVLDMYTKCPVVTLKETGGTYMYFREREMMLNNTGHDYGSTCMCHVEYNVMK